MNLFSLNSRPPVTGAGRACVRNLVSNSHCQACMQACLTGAVTLTHGKMEINAEDCIACGACLYACPAGAIEGILPAQRHYRHHSLVMPLSRIAPVVEELLMWHAEYEIRTVEMDADAHPGWLRSVAALNIRLKQMGEPLWNITPPPIKTLNGSRRQWLHIKNDTDSTGSVTPGAQIRRASFPQVSEYHIALHPDRCTLCGACSRICPQEAIQLTSHAYTLTPARCTGCGNCEAICFDHAITVQEGNQTDVCVFPVEDAQCSTCRRPFSAWSAKEEKCPVCRRHVFGMREA